MFKVLVIGENPKEMIEEYDSNKKVKPYIVFEADKAGKYKEQTIRSYEAILASAKEETPYTDYIRASIEDWKNMSDDEFYVELTEGYELDAETGNAISDKNPKGMYDSLTMTNVFIEPFILKDGTEAFSARKKDIDWSKMHLSNPEAYEVAWDTVMEGKKPKTEDERTIYNNMKERVHYFTLFGDRENYIKSNTAFWAYAIVNKDGWSELEGIQFKWVTEFFDRFIKPLPDSTLLTLFECIRN